jgi:hypothetical protein
MSLSQYVCFGCGSVLKETNENLFDLIPRLVELCPECGANLADVLKRKTQTEADDQENQTRLKLQTAYDLTQKFRLDIPKIDPLFHFGLTGSYCIIGHLANTILTRICIKALMPSRNYGGLDSPFVIVVDAGNKSDFYESAKFAKQYGMNIKSTLDRIKVSRMFTIHQLENLITKELPKVIARYHARAIVIPGLLDLFNEDPNINENEAKRAIGRISTSIDKLADKLLIIVSVSEGAKYAGLVQKTFQKRIVTKKESTKQQKINVTLYDGVNEQTTSVTEKELRCVPTGNRY